MVADIEELEEMDASELYARKLNAKEVWRSASENIHLNLGQPRHRRRTR